MFRYFRHTTATLLLLAAMLPRAMLPLLLMMLLSLMLLYFAIALLSMITMLMLIFVTRMAMPYAIYAAILRCLCRVLMPRHVAMIFAARLFRRLLLFCLVELPIMLFLLLLPRYWRTMLLMMLIAADFIRLRFYAFFSLLIRLFAACAPPLMLAMPLSVI